MAMQASRLIAIIVPLALASCAEEQDTRQAGVSDDQCLREAMTSDRTLSFAAAVQKCGVGTPDLSGDPDMQLAAAGSRYPFIVSKVDPGGTKTLLYCDLRPHQKRMDDPLPYPDLHQCNVMSAGPQR